MCFLTPKHAVLVHVRLMTSSNACFFRQLITTQNTSSNVSQAEFVTLTINNSHYVQIIPFNLPRNIEINTCTECSEKHDQMSRRDATFSRSAMDDSSGNRNSHAATKRPAMMHKTGRRGQTSVTHVTGCTIFLLFSYY